jgi:leucyl-tRNA synthetase
MVAVKQEVSAISKSVPAEIANQKEKLLDRLTELVEEVNESTNYRTKKDIASSFSKAEKKVVQAMMEVLSRNFERTTVDSLYREFLAELKSEGKKK